MNIRAKLLTRLVVALSAAGVASIGVAAVGCDDGANTSGGAAGTTGSGGSTGGVCHRAVIAPNACVVTADCAVTASSPSQAVCFAPGTSSCSGVGGPQAPTCQVTSDCAALGFTAEFVCQHAGYELVGRCGSKCTADTGCAPSHACDLATGLCAPRSCETTACPANSACTAAKFCACEACNEARPCAEGFTCSSTTFSCVATPCTGQSEGECGPSFQCDVAAGACTRRTCTCDDECSSGGYCVGGSCTAEPGHCDGPCAAGRPLITHEGRFVVAPLLHVGRSDGWDAATPRSTPAG